MHSNSIYHRDLKPENIIIDISNWKIKIIDLGLSTMESEATTNLGTPLF